MFLALVLTISVFGLMLAGALYLVYLETELDLPPRHGSHPSRTAHS